MGSFAAAPGDPGWSLPLMYYHTSAEAGGSKSFKAGGLVAVGLDVRADLVLATPTYVFKSPLAGGQASVAMAGLLGRAEVGANATLTGPGGD